MAKKTLLSSHLLGFQRIHLPPKWKDSANSLKMNLGFLESSPNITKKAGSPMNHFCEIIGITPKSIFAKRSGWSLISTSSLGCRAETRDATVGLRPTGNFNERPSNAGPGVRLMRGVFPKFPYVLQKKSVRVSHRYVVWHSDRQPPEPDGMNRDFTPSSFCGSTGCTCQQDNFLRRSSEVGLSRKDQLLNTLGKMNMFETQILEGLV